MSLFESIILGALQGLTEFLPVSSSGHLVLTQSLLGVKQPGVSFEVIVHLGTLLSVLVYFRKRLTGLVRSLFEREARDERAMILYLAIGSLPAAAVGLVLKDFFDTAFSNPIMTSVMLLITGLILLSTRFKRESSRSLTVRSGFLIGIGQALAIMPGISRSGSTIAAGMHLGIKPEVAAEFSFLLAVPAIGGAVLLNISELLHLTDRDLLAHSVGALTAFAFGLFSVYLVLDLIRRGRFEYFAYYCFAAGLFGLYLFL